MRIVAMLAGVGAALLLARWLGPAEFGRYSFALSVVTLVTLPLVQGLPVLAIREVSQASSSDRAGVIARLHWFSLLLLGALLALGVLVLLIRSLGIGSRAEAGNLWLFALAAVVPLLIMYGQVLGAMLRGSQRDVAGHAGDLVVRPIGFLVAIAMLWWVSGTPSAVSAMTANAAAICFGVAVSLFVLLPGLARPEVPVRLWLASLLPLSSVAGLQLVNGELGLVLIGLFRDDAEVGYYRIASTLALQTSFLLTVVNAVAAPRFAAAYSRGDFAMVKALNGRSGVMAVGFGLLIFGCYAAAGRWAIEKALGLEFVAAMLPLLILSGAHVATLFAGSTNVLLSMIGHERIVLRAALLALGVNSALSLVLVPVWGMSGAAVGAAVSLAVWRLYLYCQLGRVLDRAAGGAQ